MGMLEEGTGGRPIGAAREATAPGAPIAARKAPLPLTARQLEIVELVSRGCTNREIAEALGIRTATVKRHLERIYDRAGVRTRAGVAAKVLLAREGTRPS